MLRGFADPSSSCGLAQAMRVVFDLLELSCAAIRPLPERSGHLSDAHRAGFMSRRPSGVVRLRVDRHWTISVLILIVRHPFQRQPLNCWVLAIRAVFNLAWAERQLRD